MPSVPCSSDDNNILLKLLQQEVRNPGSTTKLMGKSGTTIERHHNKTDLLAMPRSAGRNGLLIDRISSLERKHSYKDKVNSLNIEIYI